MLTLLSLTFLSFFDLSAASARALEADVRARFAAAVPKLKGKYLHNRRITIRYTFEPFADKSPMLSHTKRYQGTFVTILDDGGNSAVETTNAADGSISTDFLVDIRSFGVGQTDGVHRMKNYKYHTSAEFYPSSLHPSILPYRVLAFDGERTIEDYVTSAKFKSFDLLTIAVDSFGPGQFGGRRCQELKIRGETVLKRTLNSPTSPSTYAASYFYDPENDLAYLGGVYVTPGNIAYPTPHRRIDRLEYRTVAGEDRPMPTRFTRHIAFDGGPELLHMDHEYLAYERYVPHPDEFRLETKYGLPTPFGLETQPPDPAVVAARGQAWVKWAVFGVVVFGIVAACAGLLVRRRRHKPA